MDILTAISCYGHAASRLDARGPVDKRRMAPRSFVHHALQRTTMSKNKEVADRRSWWRKHFDDHPGAATKISDTFVKSDTGQTKTRKVYCKACLVADIQQIMVEDLHAFDQRRLNAVRTEREIQIHRELINWFVYIGLTLITIYGVWGKARSSPGTGGFIRYAVTTCINHLKPCPNQPTDVHLQAQTEAESPKKQRYSPYGNAWSGVTLVARPFPSGSRSSRMPPPSLPPSTRFNSPALHSQTSRGPSPAMSTQPSPQSLSVLPLPMINTLPSPYGSLRSPLYPDQSPAMSTPHSLCVEPPASHIIQSVSPLSQGEWSQELQARFETQIARLTASAGLPLTWVDNPEWIDFVHQFLPAAKSPSRKILTTRLIPCLAKDYCRLAKDSSRDQNATIQANGWTGGNFHHLLAFMIAVGKKVRPTIFTGSTNNYC